MTRWFRRPTQLLAALGLVSLSAPAAAQDIAAAEALFDRGLADMKAGRYETGCKALAESERLDPQPGTLFTLASCEARWGRVATAAARFKDYMALFDRMTRAEKARQGRRPQVAAQEIDALSRRVPRLALSLPPGAPAGTVVRRDGHELGDASLGVALPVDPGEHRIAIEMPGGAVQEQRITIAEGESKALVLDIKKGAPPPTSGAPEAPAGRRTAAYVAGGVGVAGLALGGIVGALVLGKKGVIDRHCGSAIQASDPKACDATGLDAANGANAMAVVSTLGFGVGLAGLGAAAVLLWTEPTPAGAATGARPRWVSAGVLEAGPAGAVLGARGSF
ncbi:hypothetical protein WMF26_00295 [Sorangium sp. So ce185]|uniref:hypothetical protein n=1 Tax=Sorangium sp. So ce185 TaxID=3133287 RepID=UPI003F60A0C4